MAGGDRASYQITEFCHVGAHANAIPSRENHGGELNMQVKVAKDEMKGAGTTKPFTMNAIGSTPQHSAAMDAIQGGPLCTLGRFVMVLRSTWHHWSMDFLTMAILWS